MSGLDLTPDLRHVETWLFDLDNTLYPAECEFMALIEGKMTDFMERATGLPREKARAIQKRYYTEHGTTLAGLMAHHGIEPKEFLDEVHDVSMDCLTPDPALRAAIEALPGRRLVFTNGSLGHADRVLNHLGLAHLMEDVFAIETADYLPKPAMATFEKVVARHALAPPATAFFSHWWVVHSPSIFSDTRTLPASIISRVSSTAVRTGPVVAVETPSRASQAASTSV
jgi:putative hydrolase of the HAD superfamily